MECDYSSHSISEDYFTRGRQDSRLLEQEHNAASVQLEKYMEDIIYAKFLNYSKSDSEVLEDLQPLDYVELEGLSDPGPRDTSFGTVLYKV